MSAKNVSVIGLGRLGVPMAVCFASKGFQVIGVDVDSRKVEAINQGVAPFFEPGLADLLKAGNLHLTGRKDARAAVLASEVTFVVVPTPSEPNGGFSLRHVLRACEAIGRAMRDKADFHLVVLTSTVMPGSTGGPVRSTLEKLSGKRCGREFGLCYSPEFIALGSVIRDLLNPDFILIGESDPRSGEMLQGLYQNVCENEPAVTRMNFVNAELAKLAVNTFVTTKIGFANMLARICERLDEAHVDVVTSALALDRRIGVGYLTGAIGYGGPCFPRDNVALASFARRIGARPTLAEATNRANLEGVRGLAAFVKRKVRPSGAVGILGLSYKPNTDVVEQSQGVLLAQLLLSRGLSVVVFDPEAMDNARRVLAGQARFTGSAEKCIQQADVVVLATPWEEFRSLEPAVFARPGRPRVVIDCWRSLNLAGQDGVDYIPLGVGGIGKRFRKK